MSNSVAVQVNVENNAGNGASLPALTLLEMIKLYCSLHCVLFRSVLVSGSETAERILNILNIRH